MNSDANLSIPKQIKLFGVDIDNKHMHEAIDFIADKVKNNETSKIAFVNTDCLNKVTVNQEYRESLKNFDQIYADGIGIKIGCRMRNIVVVDNVNGTDMFPLLCEKSVQNDMKMFLLGAKHGITEKCSENMMQAYPGLKIVGTHHGYFSGEETDHVINTINQSGANILIVGFGAPLQEQWIDKNASKLLTNVQIGVGGLFDFYSGRVPRAPIWMREAGCEWVWRLMQEPKRMWNRYIVGNPLYLVRALKFSKNYLKAENIGLFDQDKLNSSLVNRYSHIQEKRINHQFNKYLKQISKNIVESSFVIGKRVIDITVSMIALTALFPFLLAVLILIRIESEGTIFFSQTRVGLNGKLFKMWKFRSMYKNAEQVQADLSHQNEMQGGVIFKVKDDPRITKVGKYIRRYSIDELPQLWNVFLGDMSLVGPRPALPNEVEQYSTADRYRLKVKPGITCIWQVSGRSNIPFDQQVKLDVTYIKKRSVLKDIWLLISTIPAVILAKGAY